MPEMAKKWTTFWTPFGPNPNHMVWAEIGEVPKHLKMTTFGGCSEGSKQRQQDEFHPLLVILVKTPPKSDILAAPAKTPIWGCLHPSGGSDLVLLRPFGGCPNPLF